jgi:hypothetical protein
MIEKETKQQMFHRLYPHHYADMEAKVKVGRTWGGEGIRQRVRALARKETRLHVKQLRDASR